MNQRLSASLFGSRAGFAQAFEQGLGRLLGCGDLNLFILVLANATFDPRLFDSLRPRLVECHAALLERYGAAGIDQAGDSVGGEDLQVWRRIAGIGLDRLNVTEQRLAGRWEIQFNQLRSFRPSGSSQRKVSSLQEPFDPRGFHFNKPFMQQEILWSGELMGRQLDLYYNKYPFVDLHALLVPDRESCLPQFLDNDIHACVWELVRVLGALIPGLRVGYNAFGAYASVNHLHLQLFVREQRLPVEDPRWQHNGGDARYPVDCFGFDDPASAWSMIERLHAAGQTYNLLYSAGHMYCLPRKRQGEFELVEWSSGFSWYELCGGFITYRREACFALSDACVESGLARVKLDDGDI